MASKVTIVNAALHKLGGKRIASFDDESSNADLARDTYEQLRDKLLRAHDWDFASRRASLAASATSPVWEFESAYPLPSGSEAAPPLWALRVLEVESLIGAEWQVEGREIVTNISGPIKIRYAARVEDVDSYPPDFYESLVTLLAREWAGKITELEHRVNAMASLHQEAVREAKVNSAQQGTPNQIEATEWTDEHR